jgi:hypothetical protein
MMWACAALALISYFNIEILVTKVSSERLQEFVKTKSSTVDLSDPREAIAYFCTLISVFVIEPKSNADDIEIFKRVIWDHLKLHAGDVRPIHVLVKTACEEVHRNLASKKHDEHILLDILAEAVLKLARIVKLNPFNIQWEPIRPLLAHGIKAETKKKA